MPTTYHEEHPLDREAMVAFRRQLASYPPFVVSAETRPMYDASIEATPAAAGVEYARDTIGGIDGWWCLPKTAAMDTAFLYLHGGGYVVGSAAAFRNFVGQIAARASLRAFIPDYGRAPERRFPGAFEDALAAYRGLTNAGNRRIALVFLSGKVHR